MGEFCLPRAPSTWTELDRWFGARETTEKALKRFHSQGAHAQGSGEGVNCAGEGMVFAGTAQSTLAEGRMWIDRREVVPGGVGGHQSTGRAGVGRPHGGAPGGAGGTGTGGPGGKLSDQNMRPEASWSAMRCRRWSS